MAVQGTEPISAANLQAIFNTDGGSSPIADAIYPVGSIYMSVNSANPQTLFGGKWQRIQGRFLFAADSTHAAGTTGGEETHKLTVNEIPSHSHTIKGAMHPNTANFSHVALGETRTSYNTVSINETGGDQPHNNMPPYLSVYMWKRTA